MLGTAIFRFDARDFRLSQLAHEVFNLLERWLDARIQWHVLSFRQLAGWT